MTKQTTEELENSNRVYEAGFLLLSSVPEEHISQEVENIKKVIERHGGAPFSEETPKPRTLAYEMEKTIETRKQRFSTAYFGWIKFESDSQNLPLIKEELDKNPNILRFILLKTSKETPKTVSESAKEESSREVVDEKEIDKSIDELVLE